MKRSNSSQHQPPKKRRQRKKKEEQTILFRERSIFQNFPRKFIPKSALKVDHNLGRKKQWVIQQQKGLVPDDKLLTNKPEFMSEHFKILRDNGQTLKSLSKGCEYKWDGKEK